MPTACLYKELQMCEKTAAIWGHERLKLLGRGGKNRLSSNHQTDNKAFVLSLLHAKMSFANASWLWYDFCLTNWVKPQVCPKLDASYKFRTCSKRCHCFHAWSHFACQRRGALLWVQSRQKSTSLTVWTPTPQFPLIEPFYPLFRSRIWPEISLGSRLVLQLCFKIISPA